VDHHQGQGKLAAWECDVQFVFFEPEDLQETPYLLWVSYGSHTHLPPPPVKTPKDIFDDVVAIVRRISDPALTTGTRALMYYKSITNIFTAGLLKHQAMHDLCKKYEGSTIVDIHKSFTNLDAISSLLRKERLLMYPFGEGYAAVQYEFEIRQKDMGADQASH
jgi:hypothetical protein